MTLLSADRSETAIASQALLLIEADPITNFTESEAARTAKRFFPTVRDAVLRAYRWNFARKKATIAASATAPPFEFGYSYNLPPDCLAVRKVVGVCAEDWRVEGATLQTDAEGPLQIVYTFEARNPALWDALFVDVFIHSLALRCAPKVARSRSIKQDVRADLDLLLREARRVDANEGTEDELAEGDWVLARS